MIRRTPSLTYAVVLASLAVSCGWPEHRLRVLHDALRLTVTGPERIASGTRTTVTLSLRNVSAEAVDVCIGPSKYIVVGSMLMTDVDPERCERRLTLEPSAESTWDETFETPFAPAGPTELEVGLRIAEPTFCFGGSCFTTALSGQRTVVVE